MPEAVFADPKVASVGTAKGDQVLTAVHMIEGARGSVLGRTWRPCFLGGADGTKESAIV